MVLLSFTITNLNRCHWLATMSQEISMLIVITIRPLLAQCQANIWRTVIPIPNQHFFRFYLLLLFNVCVCVCMMCTWKRVHTSWQAYTDLRTMLWNLFSPSIMWVLGPNHYPGLSSTCLHLLTLLHGLKQWLWNNFMNLIFTRLWA